MQSASFLLRLGVKKSRSSVQLWLQAYGKVRRSALWNTFRSSSSPAARGGGGQWEDKAPLVKCLHRQMAQVLPSAMSMDTLCMGCGLGTGVWDHWRPHLPSFAPSPSPGSPPLLLAPHQGAWCLPRAAGGCWQCGTDQSEHCERKNSTLTNARLNHMFGISWVTNRGNFPRKLWARTQAGSSGTAAQGVRATLWDSRGTSAR